MIHNCDQCDYKSTHKWSVRRHMQTKHKNIAPSEQSRDGNSPPKQMQHSNLQEESMDQLYKNIDQWQKAYDTLKEQYQQVEKVTTCNDGRPSHVSIQLYDKCCKGLTDYMHYCKGLINLCQRVHTEKEQQLDRFCTAWEELKWERDNFANEINRRDCCGEGVIDEKCARKLREKNVEGSEQNKMLRDPNIIKIS